MGGVCLCWNPGAMIHESSITLQTTRVGQLRVDSLQIRGDREASRPTLIVQLGVELFKGEHPSMSLSFGGEDADVR